MKLNEPFLFLKHNNGICDLLCTDDFNLLGGLNVTVRAPFSRFFALLAKRPSTAMSDEKLLPFAGYTMCSTNNSIKAKQVLNKR